MQKFTWLSALTIAAGLASTSPVSAAPIKYYDMTFTVTASNPWPQFDCARPPQRTNIMFPEQPPQYAPNWGCINAGDVYLGRIGIDTDLIGRDGVFSRRGGPSSFELEFGRLVVGKGYKSDGVHYMPGFASAGCDFVWSCTTYRMKDGELTGLFVSAWLTGDSASITLDLNGTFTGGGNGTSFAGELSLQAVPEPMSLALVGVAAFGAVMATRRGRRQIHG